MPATPARPHVMHLLATFDVGGAESVALSLACAVKNEGFHVSACALQDGGEIRRRFEVCQHQQGPKRGLVIRRIV